jgi:hypothetical protein
MFGVSEREQKLPMVIIINKTVLFNGESARFSIFDLLAPAESCPQRIAIKINRVTVVRDGERSQTLCEKEKTVNKISVACFTRFH